MKKLFAGFTALVFCALSVLLLSTPSYSITLSEIRARGELRHLGVPYARFADNNADGLDCLLIRRFAEHLGVKYTFISTNWENAISDLTGINPYSPDQSLAVRPPKGDLLANGFTILPQRERFVLFSHPTFTAQVWLLAKANADIQPISPTGNIQADIEKTVAKTIGKTVYGIEKICIDVNLFPSLRQAAGSAENIPLHTFHQPLSFVTSEYNIFLMESPSALMALGSWPYTFKIIGPVAKPQNMGVAFAKDSAELRDEFNRFFEQFWKSGEYQKLVNCYFPNSFIYFNKFFTKSFP
ncbi:transporter substrate-binding domain-containing protein [Halodesulfovibrio sp.]|uniref:transporter substrate-binding domain-containing protein n=1 Tax=Halodesulfovibrio sp. TaxID=1912772 RepID=UPI0025DE158E|nr:transporter substrate-binding domain-containing protein [Halodesulfovibrio sp.]MCT4628113.1 transporter substrate-binding domain-containing protein [Halodesulfovibrio sp.]